jgi:thiamine-phosphate pyrophosphorylase
LTSPLASALSALIVARISFDRSRTSASGAAEEEGTADDDGAAAAAAGAWAFQIREPHLGGRALSRLVTQLGELGGAARLRVIVNDRVDVALATGAFGVQLGERSLPAARVRGLAGERLAIGRSVHDPAGARQASAEGADWLLFGHVYATASKSGRAPAGVSGLAAACRAASCPVLGIGGITAATAGAVLAAGAGGVAVIGAVAMAADPAAAVAALVRALGEAACGRPLA